MTPRADLSLSAPVGAEADVRTRPAVGESTAEIHKLSFSTYLDPQGRYLVEFLRIFARNPHLLCSEISVHVNYVHTQKFR